MILSDEKISHLSHLILNTLKGGIVEFKEDEISTLREIKRIIIRELKIDEEVDGIVRKKLAPYTKKHPEGTPEWNIQYNKFFEEEMRKRGRW